MAPPTRKGNSARLKATQKARIEEQKRSETEAAIALAIEQSDDDFVSRYMCPRRACRELTERSPGDDWKRWTHPKTGAEYTLGLVSAGGLDGADFEACYGLVDQTSGDAYRSSAGGWHPEAKREEMRSPELRYLLAKRSRRAEDDDGGGGGVEGFVSFMPTWEYGDAVVYVYEIHLQPELQGTGLGRILMSHARRVASHIPGVDKVMLTCFKSNGGGLAFYRRLGFDEDENSPRDRKLRGGRVVAADYVILSWRTQLED